MLLLIVTGLQFEPWVHWLAVAMASVLVARTDTPRWRGATLFVMPIFSSVPWIVDKGDQDGLWLIEYPLVLFMIPLIVLASWAIGRVVSRRPKR